MATITLYAGKMNQMSSLLGDAKKSVSDYQSELFSLKSKTLNVNKRVCDLNDVISSVQTSTQLQEQKLDSLEALSQNVENFISDVVRIDDDAAEAINRNKDEFYDKYYYLKPSCEKNIWEKFCDGFASAGEWCKEHWKLIVTIVLVAVAIVLICTGVGGPFAAIILGAAKGLIMGAVTGGLMGGISSLAAGGSFFEGFEDGAFMGALTGALFGGLGGVGEALGSLGKLGTTCKALETLKNVARISGTISLGMGTFDLLAWGAGLFAPDNAFTAFNQQLHSNGLYNAFQFGASALAVFSLGGIKGFYEKTPNPVCFVAGTMVLTASGLTAIEKIRAGDKVISTNAETFETEEKLVLETYIRQTDKLIHLVINGEEIITTETHPFYVKDRGFVDAGELLVGDSLLDVHGNVLLIEDIQIEYPQEPETVYNFRVEDFHTYHVGNCCVLVHNANYSEQIRINAQRGREFEDKTFLEFASDEPGAVKQITIVVNKTRERVRVDMMSGSVQNGTAVDLILTEAKSSDVAPFTPNQRLGYPYLAENGGHIVGKGKAPFIGGTGIPPTEINIARPSGTKPLSKDILGSKLGGNK